MAWLIRLLTVVLLLATPALAAPQGSFADFLKGFEAKAVAAGVSEATWRAATDGLTPDPNVPKLVESQPEFTTPMWDYLDKRVTAGRIERGRAAIGKNEALFQAGWRSAPASIPTFSARSGAWRPTMARCWATAS